jgi:hypothetical protein
MNMTPADAPRPSLCRPHRFDFEIDPRFAVPLTLIGVRPKTAWVDVDPHEIEVRFGLHRVRTRRTNIAHVCLSGPYRWWKAIGVRLSLADKGATFGSATEAGICLTFHSPVGILPGGRLRCPSLTVTVADPVGLQRALGDHF